MANANIAESKTDFDLYASIDLLVEAEKLNQLDDVARKLMTEMPTQEDGAEFSRSYHGTLPPKVFTILVNHRILLPNGQPVMTNLELPEKSPLGRGPLLDPDAWQRMVAADTTPDHVWTEWIFDRAAGGQAAKEHSRRALDQMYRRFIDERVSGFKHADTGQWYPPVSREEAETRWTMRKPHPTKPGVLKPSTEMRFKRMLYAADQDRASKLQCYGYYRHWPGGPDRNYQAITEAVSKFLSLESMCVKLNALVEKGDGLGESSVSFDPDAYPDASALLTTCKRVERFFAAQTAAKDVRVANDKYVYSDDFVSVIVPLTYAAAVRYGWQEWAWANKENFEKMLMNKSSSDYWKLHTRENVIAIMRFKKPMPGWVVRSRNEFRTPTLTNLAVFMPIQHLGSLSIQDDLKFWDEENRQNLSYAEVAHIITSEPDRPDDTEQDAMLPIKSWKVFKTKDDAASALQHFNHALEQLVAWASKFEHSTVKSDALTLDAPKMKRS